MNQLRVNRKLQMLILLTIAWITLIFSFSLQSGDESGKLSGGIVAWIVALFFPEDFAHIELVHFLVRKAAHFTEYFVLGLLFSATTREAKWANPFLKSWALGTLVACCDETIQLFSDGRAGQITDVMLDSTGVLTGCLLLMWGLAMCERWQSVERP